MNLISELVNELAGGMTVAMPAGDKVAELETIIRRLAVHQAFNEVFPAVGAAYLLSQDSERRIALFLERAGESRNVAEGTLEESVVLPGAYLLAGYRMPSRLAIEIAEAAGWLSGLGVADSEFQRLAQRRDDAWNKVREYREVKSAEALWQWHEARISELMKTIQKYRMRASDTGHGRLVKNSLNVFERVHLSIRFNEPALQAQNSFFNLGFGYGHIAYVALLDYLGRG